MTTELFLVAAATALVVDLVLLWLVFCTISLQRYYSLAWAVLASAFTFWSILWKVMLAWGWEWFYGYIFPEWAKNWTPVLGITYAFVGMLIWWMATKLPGNPAINFCLLGGFEGIISHIYALFGLQAIENVPLLAGVDPFAIIIFALAEKILYWSLVLYLAVILQSIWLLLKRFLNERFKVIST